MLNIKSDEKGYKAFIDFAGETCDYISLVFEKSETDNSRYVFQDEYFLLRDSLIKKENLHIHPDTGSCFDNADILYFNADASVISFLKHASGISDWNGELFPEELCFYRGNKAWFTFASHENLLRIYDETDEDLKFLKSNKIEFSYE